MKKNGYITLLSVLIVGTVGSAIALSVILLGLGSSRTSLSYQQLVKARAIAHACVEEGLLNLRASSTFVGSGNLSFAPDSCTYSITTQGGENRMVYATGTVGTIIRKTRVIIIDINPTILISSWQEIP